MKSGRRILAFILSFLMIATMLPQDIQAVYAATDNGSDILLEGPASAQVLGEDLHVHEENILDDSSDIHDHEHVYEHEHEYEPDALIMESNDELKDSSDGLVQITEAEGRSEDEADNRLNDSLIDPEGFSPDNFKANISEIHIGQPIPGEKKLPVTVVFNAKEDLSSDGLVYFLEGLAKTILKSGKKSDGINGVGMTLIGPLKPDVELWNNSWSWEWNESKMEGKGILKYEIPLLEKDDTQEVEKSPATGMMEVNGVKEGDSINLQIETWLKGIPGTDYVKGNEAKFTVEDLSKYPKTIKVSGNTCKHTGAKIYKRNGAKTHSVICAECGEVIDPAEAHTWSTWGFRKKCSKCNCKKPRKMSKDTSKVVGLKLKESGEEDKDYEYTETEAKKIGITDEAGESFVKGKEYTEVIEKSTGGGNDTWKITYKPVEGMTEEGSEPIETEVRRSDDKHNVTVNYVLGDSTGKTVYPTKTVSPTVVNSYKEGEHFEIPSPVVQIETEGGSYTGFYRRSDSVISGTMGDKDLSYTVTYWEENVSALVDFTVNVTYVVEARAGEAPTVPDKVKQYKKDGESYFIKSPPVEGYKPDVEAVAGKIEHDNVDVTVAYKPQYKVTVHYKLPSENAAGMGSYTITDYYPDGAEYKYDSNDAITGKTAKQLGLAISASIPRDATYDMTNVWKPDPAVVSGTINGADKEYTVNFTCLHPLGDRTYENMGESGHQHLCRLCHSYVRTAVPHTKSEKGYYVSKDELPDDLKDKPEYKNGATCYDCVKNCGYHFYESSDKEKCPASPIGDSHIWGNWEKVSDTECARTCARCKETVTAAHAWSEWKSCSGRNHYRTCDHCHSSEIGTHGGFNAPTVGTPATCLSPARGVKAHCSICNTDIEDVDPCLYGVMPDGDKLVAQGHKFDGGYVRINGGHTQKCSVCGAFDMEHVEAHFQSEPVTEKEGSCGNGTIKRTYTCACGLTKTEEEDWKHSFKRDTAREVNPTCEEPGTECYTCTECNAHDDKNVEKLGHNWVEDEGNYEATCEHAGRKSQHCSNPGCEETKLEEPPMLSKTGQHTWEKLWITKPTCTTYGQSKGRKCTVCKTTEIGFVEKEPMLEHQLDTNIKTIRKRTFNTKSGADGYEEVFEVTNKCKNCGYNFPKAIYTVARSSSLSKYKIEPGNVKITEMGDGIKVTGQFWKWNSNYFNNTVDSAFKEVKDNLLNIYRKKEGSVITEFTPQFMNSLEDGKYEMVHTNGDELSAATLTVKDNKFVLDPADYDGGADDPKYKDGQLPGIKALDEWNALPEDKYEAQEIIVDGETQEYYPWMADGELLFYLGEAENNFIPEDKVPVMEGYQRQNIEGDPAVDPSYVSFDKQAGNPDNRDMDAIRYDNGHEFDKDNPVTLFGTAVPAIEMIPAGGGMEPFQRTNYIISETGSKVTFTKEYLSSLGEGTYEFLLNYKDGAPSASFTVVITGNAEEPTDNIPITFDGEYYALNKGETKQLEISGITDEQKAKVVWTIVDADGNPGDAVTLDESTGIVTAAKKGTAWVVASIGNSSTRCRFDVYETDPELVNVRLAENKVTSELYSDEYARIGIWLDLKQNLNPEILAESNGIVPEGIVSDPNNGIFISKAEFTDPAAAEVFDLRVNDDGTASVIPKDKYVNGDAAVLKTLKGSYKSAIKVTAGGNEYTTEEVTITLKKSMPKLKAGKISLNSAIEKGSAKVEITGGTVTGIEINGTAPEWVKFEDDKLIYTGTRYAKLKAKVTLDVTVKGWVPKVQVAVDVNAAPVPAKFKLSAKSVTLNPEAGDEALVDVTVTPDIYASEFPEISVTENKTAAVGKALLCNYNGGRLTVKCADGFDDSKARTFKIELKVANQTASITVKTLAKGNKPKIKVKSSGEINTKIVKSPAVLEITPVNYNKDAGMTYEIQAVAYDKTTKSERDVTSLLNIETDGNRIALTEQTTGSLGAGEYYVYVTGSTRAGKTEPVKAKLKVTDPKKTPAASVSVKVKGSFDVIRPDTEVNVIPTVKNFYDYSLDESNLIIYKGQGKNVKEAGTGADNEYFDVKWSGNAYTLKLKSSAKINHLADKFSVGIKVNDTLKTDKPVNLSVNMGSAKLSQSTKAVIMSSQDRYSEGVVEIGVITTDVSGIDKVEIVSPVDKNTKKEYFDVKALGGGKYAIVYKDNMIRSTKGGTVKLNVYLKGNNTAGTAKEKPNGKLSVKVAVK